MMLETGQGQDVDVCIIAISGLAPHMITRSSRDELLLRARRPFCNTIRWTTGYVLLPR